MPGVRGKPQKFKFRIESEGQTRSLIQIHKSFHRRNSHTREKQLLAVVAGQEEPTPLPERTPFYQGKKMHP